MYGCSKTTGESLDICTYPNPAERDMGVRATENAEISPTQTAKEQHVARSDM